MNREPFSAKVEMDLTLECGTVLDVAQICSHINLTAPPPEGIKFPARGRLRISVDGEESFRDLTIVPTKFDYRFRVIDDSWRLGPFEFEWIEARVQEPPQGSECLFAMLNEGSWLSEFMGDWEGEWLDHDPVSGILVIRDDCDGDWLAATHWARIPMPTKKDDDEHPSPIN